MLYARDIRPGNERSLRDGIPLSISGCQQPNDYKFTIPAGLPTPSDVLCLSIPASAQATVDPVSCSPQVVHESRRYPRSRTSHSPHPARTSALGHEARVVSSLRSPIQPFAGGTAGHYPSRSRSCLRSWRAVFSCACATCIS